MAKQVCRAALLVLQMSLLLPVQAETLNDVYQDALRFDPTFQAVFARYQLDQNAVKEAYASFLPQLGVTGVWKPKNKNSNDEFSVNASQVLFNWSVFKNISKAHSVKRLALYHLLAGQQDLVRRSIDAYLSVVSSQALVRVAREQVSNMKQQLYAVRERYKLKYATVTDLDRVKARYDLYQSQLLTEKIKYHEKRDWLAQLTGQVYEQFSKLRFNFKLVKPKPQSESVWLDKASTQNLAYFVANQDVLVAKKQIAVKQGEFLPGLVVQGAYFPKRAGASKDKYEYGIGIDYQFFQGGKTVAEVRHAKTALEEAQIARSRARQVARSTALSAYHGMREGVYQLKVQRRAVMSNRSALRHTQASYLAGSQTIIDVLDQQTSLLEAEKQYVAARVAYLRSIVNLEWAAGTLSPQTVTWIAKWLRR